MAELKLISAESVTEGHPDKVCDQISDAILDDMLAQDPHSHVAVETCATVGQFFVFGEVTSEGYSDIQNIVRSVVRNIGYTSSRVGLDADSCGVTVSLTEQSPEINQGVARLSGEEESKASREQRYEAQGAGDQGVMFGYACDETDVLMPLPIHLAHRLAYRLAEVRKSGEVPHLRPDGKTQVTIEYDDDDHPVRLDTVLVSTQHDPEVDQAWLKEQLTEVECPVCHTLHKVKDLEQWEKCAALPEKKAVEQAEAAYKQAMEAFVQAQRDSSASKATYEAVLDSTLQKAQELLASTISWEELQQEAPAANPLALALAQKREQAERLQQEFNRAAAQAEQQEKLEGELETYKAGLPALKKTWEDGLLQRDEAKHAVEAQKHAVATTQGMLAGCPATSEQAVDDLNAAKKQKTMLQQAINTAQAQYADCVKAMALDKGKLEQAQKNQQPLVEKRAGYAAAYQAVLAECALTEAAFLAMHEEHRSKKTGHKLTGNNVAEAVKNTRAYVEEKRHQEQEYVHDIKRLTEELAGKQRLDTTALVAEMNAINAVLKSSKEHKETLQTDKDFTEQTLQKVTACYQNRRKKQRVHSVIEPLAEAANGAITFNRYVLEDLFCAMLDKANDRLSVLCSGQYELRPIEEGQSKRNKGLGFTVYDCINQSHRESGANSGGEKFEISLSLALGLSDIVQSCSKKASRIESLFIDEGFGTLGKEELEKTKRLLLELSGGSRQIGIISHNPVLEEAIKNQIVVERDKQTRAGTKVSFKLDC